MTDTLPPDPNGKKFLPYRQSATPTTDTDRLTRAREIRRQNFAARSLVVDHAILTGAQRVTVREALDAADKFIVHQYAQITRLESETTHPELSGYLEAAHGLICNAHRARVDDVTEADGASPGWAEAARKWIDAYPPKPTHDGHAEFAAEVRRIGAARAADTQELKAAHDRVLDERDTAIRERDRLRDRNEKIEAARVEQARTIGELRAERDKAVHQLGQVTDQLDRVRADRDEAKGLTNSLITARDKANHRYRVEKTRADRLGRDRAWLEHQLNQIRAFVAPPAPDPEPEPGDSWTDHVHERQELARKLRESRGRVVRLHSDTGPRHIYDHDITEQTPPVFRRWNPDHRPTDDELAEAVDMTAAEFREAFNRAMPGPRPGPTPATPSAIGHSPSLHMLGACPCQAGTPFDPDYTEADLGPQEG